MIKWSEDCGVCTDELTKFFNSIDTSGDIMGQYKAHLVKLQKEQSTFTAFTQKAGTALKTLGAALGSMAVNWAIGKVIDIAAIIIDNFINSAEHCKERVDELRSSYQSALDKANSNANKSY